METKKFYDEGLKFECTRCSNCCRFAPGYVFLSEEDLDRLSVSAKMTREEFIEQYCRQIDINGFKRLSLTEKPNNDCIFWGDDGCIHYEARPLQCSSYPFWYTHLFAKEVWDSLEKDCPGVNKGKLHSKEDIQRWLDLRQKERIIELD